MEATAVVTSHKLYSSSTPNQNLYVSSSHPQLPTAQKLKKRNNEIEWVMRFGSSKAIIFNTNLKARHPILLQHRQHRNVSIMAEEGGKKQDELIDEEKNKKKEEEEKKTTVLPSPPEKPLPGDCCGSGCVRCVWDIYYEELEDYNNLLKNVSQSKS